jgi:hypothetical protein
MLQTLQEPSGGPPGERWPRFWLPVIGCYRQSELGPSTWAPSTRERPFVLPSGVASQPRARAPLRRVIQARIRPPSSSSCAEEDESPPLAWEAWEAGETKAPFGNEVSALSRGPRTRFQVGAGTERSIGASEVIARSRT